MTGARGSGKTTLLHQLFSEPQPGITSWAKPGQAVYLRENISGTMVQVGAFDPSLPGNANRMKPLPDGFLRLGIPALLRCIQSDSRWVTVDEIGYLESECTEYQQAFRTLLKQKQVAAVVRKQPLAFLQELCSRKDVFVVDLDDPFGKIGCVIMASGLGKRFGSNKLLADFGGEPLICRILDATEDIFLRRVVVTRHEEIARLCRKRNISAVLHSLPNRNDTVRLGLQRMQGVERCLFAPADQPLLRRETVAALALVSKDSPHLWRLSCEGIPGSPAVFPEWAFEQLKNLPEGKGGGMVLKKYPERLHTVNIRDRYELQDVDRPEDLVELLEQR